MNVCAGEGFSYRKLPGALSSVWLAYRLLRVDRLGYRTTVPARLISRGGWYSGFPKYTGVSR